MARTVQLSVGLLVAGTVALYWAVKQAFGGDPKAVVESIHGLAAKLGPWAMPVFVLVHSVAIALCFPYAIGFEAAASFLFGFLRGVACVFCAKVTGAALAFWIGRTLFRSSVSASSWVRKNKYFSIINKGVAEDGWRFVLMARFSPIPSYIINYALAATDVRFGVDFLLPTLVGGLPMILQNASFGSLTSAATGAGGGKALGPLSYVLPAIGILSGILISWRIKKYVSMDLPVEHVIPGEKTDGKLLTAMMKTTALDDDVVILKRRPLKHKSNRAAER